MKDQLKKACRFAYLGYVDSFDARTHRTCPAKEAEYARSVEALIRFLKAEGADAMEEYYRWAAGGTDSTADHFTAPIEQDEQLTKLRHA